MSLFNDLPEVKKKYHQGTISLGHWRGHNCLIVNCYFDGFLDYTPEDSDFEYLRPSGRIIVHIDEKFKVSVLPLDFDNCIPSQIRLSPSDVP